MSDTKQNSQLFNSINLTRNAKAVAAEDENMLTDLMANPDYLRHSSSVINAALKDGFDVIQMPNGDIVATGTKTIVNTYVWDSGKARLVKAPEAKPATKRKAKVAAEESAQE